MSYVVLPYAQRSIGLKSVEGVFKEERKVLTKEKRYYALTYISG
jgi:hypothetical protein